MGRRRAELALQASPVRERLRRHAARLADRPIEEVCDALLDALRGGEVWDDDAIAVVARIRGRDDAAGPDPLAASPPPCFRLRP